MTNVLLVLTNCPDEASAERIARALVDNRLAACVNRMAPADSTFRWQGAVERAREVPVLIKTTRTRYPEVEQTIRALHPYHVPEVIAWPVEQGYGPYLRWVSDETEPPLMA
jgi:periplasmic divalent cation tolerance protein